MPVRDYGDYKDGKLYAMKQPTRTQRFSDWIGEKTRNVSDRISRSEPPSWWPFKGEEQRLRERVRAEEASQQSRNQTKKSRSSRSRSRSRSK